MIPRDQQVAGITTRRIALASAPQYTIGDNGAPALTPPGERLAVPSGK